MAVSHIKLISLSMLVLHPKMEAGGWTTVQLDRAADSSTAGASAAREVKIVSYLQ